MSKAANIEAARAVLTVVLGSLERSGAHEASAVRTALDLLDPEPSAEAKRSKSYRDRKRDGVTLASRPVTVAPRDATTDESVTRHAIVTPDARNPSLSALSLSDSAASSASASENRSGEKQRQSAREVATVTRHVTPLARETLEARDPTDSLIDAIAATLSAHGISGVSPKDRNRVARNLPLLRALAAERGCTEAEVLRAAKARFDADEETVRKGLGNAVLLAQLEVWSRMPPAPPEPKRLIPLYVPPPPGSEPEYLPPEEIARLAATVARKVQ